MIKKTRLLIGALSLAAAATLVGAPAAHAGQGGCIDASEASGCFYDYGDHVVVYDYRADGLRPQVFWETDYGRTGTCVYTGASDYTDCNYDMAEGHQIVWTLQLVSTSTGEVYDVDYAVGEI